MRFLGHERERPGLHWLAVFVLLGACRFGLAEEAPAKAPAPSRAASLRESNTPDTPEPSTTPAAAAPVSSTARQAPTSSPTPTSTAPDFPGREEAQETEAGTAEVGQEGAGERARPAPDVEAPALAGPSGGEQRPPGEGLGRDAPWWTRVPNVQPFAPLGLTIVPPSGPGYYTLWELLRGDRRDAPPKYPYPRFGIMPFPFFNADWRSLDNPETREDDPFNVFKRIFLGDDFMFTAGGEERVRYDNEVNSRFSGKDNTYYLTRTRLYGDLWYRDRFRIFGEFINAQSFDQDLPPQPIDQYNPNFLNLFADAKLGTIRDQPLWLRGGRQELIYGSERLISPLAWSNTQRTFQGGKLFWQNDKLSLDGFVVQPVVPSANSFASVNWQQVFSGVWGTYRPQPGEIVDLYYLDLQDSTLTYSGQNGVKGALNVSTVGSRWYGNKNDWLWDTEAMLQFGRYSNQGILANAFTMGGGYHFSKWWMSPTVWLYYDYASGDPTPGTGGVHRTFNQLFPFGHYYFGMMDNVGRQNINDINGKLILYPTKWITSWVEYHVLRLDSPKDALYNSAGVPTLIDPTGKAGINVGEILTLVNNFTIDLHQNVFVQYSHLYPGTFLQATEKGRSQDELYLMYAFRW